MVRKPRDDGRVRPAEDLNFCFVCSKALGCLHRKSQVSNRIKDEDEKRIESKDESENSENCTPKGRMGRAAWLSWVHFRLAS